MSEATSRTISATKQALMKALLERRLKGDDSVGPGTSEAIMPISRGGLLPLSWGQQRLWFLDQWNPGNVAYNIPLAVRLTGKLHSEALERGLQEVVRRHEVLRTRYTTQGSTPVQVVELNVSLRMERHDLQQIPEPDRAAAVERLAAEEARSPFDLTSAPLIRASLLVLGAEEHVLLLTMHHIVSDGWSLGVLLREITRYYEAFTSGGTPSVMDLPIQYADYAAWQRERLQGEKLEQEIAYWKRQLQGAPPQHELPTDRRRPSVHTARGLTHPFTLPQPLVHQLSELAQREGVTLFMVLMAAFQTLLNRYSGQEDIVVGTPVAGRTRTETEPLIGFFVNTLAIRTDLSGNPTFLQLVRRVREVLLEAYSHQELPFERLVDELQVGRDLSRTPLFQVMLALNNTPMTNMNLAGLTLEPMPVESETAKFDLTLEFWPASDGLRGRLEFSTDLFDTGTTRRMIGHFHRLLEAVIAEPATPIGHLPLLTETEQQANLQRAQVAAAYRQAPCLHQWFEEQVERTPDHVAVVFEEQRVTYRELNARANQLAHYLQKRGIGPDQLVGICVERSIDMVVGILGVLKAGGAYVPLDPAYPADRLAFIMADTQASVLLTQSHLVDLLSAHAAAVVCLDKDLAELAEESSENPVCTVMPDNLAYVIYTSGSTGKPKGVLIEHRNVVRLYTATEAWFGFSDRDVWTLFHSYAFDFTVWELWGALLYGGRLVVVPYLVSRSPERFYDLLAQEQVTVLNQTPSAFRQLIRVDGARESAAQLSALRLVIFGGEALELQSLRPWFERHGDEQPQLVNMYGITETTVHVTYRPIAMEDVLNGSGSVIGGPIPDLAIYMLDAYLNPVPEGIPGELFVGGAGLARGYLNRPELTQERFIQNPWNQNGERLYRTGDLARLLPNGDIEYLGRIDHQVKIRGFRIELGEIESALVKHPGVREAVVVALEETAGDRRLVAYIVPSPNSFPTIMEIRAFLKQALPEYMVPSTFVSMEAIPLTTNGKVDRKALPSPTEGRIDLGEQYVAPRTPVEAVLAEIWAQVLSLPRVGVQDNFFALGGDSIRSIEVLSLAKERGLVFSLQQLFKHQTIEGIAAQLQSSNEDHGESLTPTEPFCALTAADRLLVPADVEDAYPLTALQAGMLYHMEFTEGSQSYYNVTGFELRCRYDKETLQVAVQRAVDRYEVLRTSFDMATYSEPLQLVHTAAQLPLTEEDLRLVPAPQQEAAIRAWMEREKANRFDLSRPPLLRFHIHRLSAESFQFTIAECHAILDGWSLTSIINEIFIAYFALLDGSPLIEEALPALKFRDFVLLEKQVESSPETQAFWTGSLRDVTPITLPRWPGLVGGDRKFRRALRPFPAETLTRLKRLAEQVGAPLKSVLLAAHVKVLSLLSGQVDVLTGVVSNGRPEVLGGEKVRGLFLNSVPLRVQTSAGTWGDLVRATFDAELELLPHRRYPLPALQKQLGQSLFETSFNFVNFHGLHDLVQRGHMEIGGVLEQADTNFTLQAAFSLVPPAGQLIMMLDCNGAELAEAQIEQYADIYVQVLTLMAGGPQGDHMTACLLPGALRSQVLLEWNQTEQPYPLDKPLQFWIEAQVERTPDAVALVFEGESLSYRELNRRANQVAHYLRRQGVQSDTLVGICMERSLEMVVGLLGILKAGGAYVPLDPGYPRERLTYMMADATLPVLLTQDRFRGLLHEHGASTLCLDTEWGHICGESEENPEATAGPDNLAYMIYTSGSTGRPKGALVSHRGICNRLFWMQEAYQLTVDDRVLQKTPISFDVSVWELFWPLMTGARLVIARAGGHQDPSYLVNLIQTEQITTLHFVPSMLQLFLEEPGVALCTGIRRVICSGEALPIELQARFFERLNAPLYNLYGPTEAAVDVTHWTCDRTSQLGFVPIGRPVANTQIYVLDRHLNPVPAGVPGELHIGGVQVGPGYRNRPELTAEKFIPDPFAHGDGARLYKTGDLACFLPDGTIQYLGRMDHQVKIRGFRIELGEIEAALSAHPSVRDAAVTVQEPEPGHKRLVAYVVARGGGTVTVSDLCEHLKQRLPEYMVPAAFMVLDTMPLSPSGKVDRLALPAPDQGRPNLSEAYVAATNDVEERLVRIWAQVLHRQEVGVHDNFFELGGDSILAFQVMARANQQGLRFTPKMLFENQTIAALARVVGTAPEVQAEQGPVTGAVPLTPVQRWFFAQDSPNPNHYNQAFLFAVRHRLDSARLEQVVGHLLTHHDALRLRFVQERGEWRQVNVAPDRSVPLEVVDLSQIPENDWAHRISEQSAKVQASLDLKHGPLLRMVLFDGGEEQPGYLLLVVHHLAIDGVSWRVILEDFQTAFQQLSSGKPIALPAKTTSFRHWAERLSEHARSRELRREVDYWLSPERLRAQPLPVDFPDGQNTEASAKTYTITLEAETTRNLLTEAPKAYRTQINDLLLTALLESLSGWTGQKGLLVDLEGHGREPLFADVDLSRTVGWFTGIYPLQLDAGEARETGDLIKSVKEQIRSVPNHGVGFGILRYLTGAAEVAERLGALPAAELLFNYLGQVDQSLETAGFGLAKVQIGSTRSLEAKRSHILGVDAAVVDGRLEISWTYSSDLHRPSTIEHLADRYLSALRAVVSHCVSPAAGGFTPSDFPKARLSQKELDKFVTLISRRSGGRQS